MICPVPLFFIFLPPPTLPPHPHPEPSNTNLARTESVYSGLLEKSTDLWIKTGFILLKKFLDGSSDAWRNFPSIKASNVLLDTSLGEKTVYERD